MKKINASKWVNDYKLDSATNNYLAETPFYNLIESRHGKSKAETACGFCNARHEVYIWSFMGCGKRCANCNALICYDLTFAETSKVVGLLPPINN